MKNFVIFILAAVIFLACKKKKEEEAPAPTPTTPAHVNYMTAKLNGIDWAMGNNAYVTGNSNQIFSFGGRASNTSFNRQINLTFTYTLGTVNFGGSGIWAAQYIDSVGTYFTARTGSMNITALDTFQYGVKKIIGTFSFKTDTIGGKSYNVTNGAMDYIQQ